MARYCLNIQDGYSNHFYVPMGRGKELAREKAELYEIDLITTTLGENDFIDKLKELHIAPMQFDWNFVEGSVQYIVNQEVHCLPLIFERDPLLLKIIQVHNKYRYHLGMSEAQLIHKITEPGAQLPYDLIDMLHSIIHYRDDILQLVSQNKELLNDPNLSKKLKELIYVWMQCNTYDEKREYEHDLLRQMLSYINLRRLKAMEYGIHMYQAIVDIPQVSKNNLTQPYGFPEKDDSVDPDEYAFLTEEELAQMYGEVEEDEKSHGR